MAACHVLHLEQIVEVTSVHMPDVGSLKNSNAQTRIINLIQGHPAKVLLFKNCSAQRARMQKIGA